MRATTTTRSVETTRKIRLVLAACLMVNMAVILIALRDDRSVPAVKSKLFDDTNTESKQCEQRVLNKNSERYSHLSAEEIRYFKSDKPAPATSCDGLNSKTWLEGPRLGNYHDPLMTPEIIQRMILDIPSILRNDSNSKSKKSRAQDVLGTSLCYEQSGFMQDTEVATDAKSVRLWSVRLIYLALHYHQHRLAIPEAAARYNKANEGSCPDKLFRQHGVGNFDYECGREAKFLLVPMSGNGLGSNVRGAAVPALVAGLRTNRIVLFINNSPVGDKLARSKWPLVGCDRKDAQCFFLPASPCTLTHQDIQNSYSMDKYDMRKFVNKAELPKGHENDKVINYFGSMRPQLNVPMSVRERLATYAHALIDTVPCDDPRLPAMRLGADLILQDDAPRAGYNYAAAGEKMQHAAAFYFMRPNLEHVTKIDAILGEIVPKGLDAERSVGLPIRASDKCIGESDCLSFDEHMRAVSEMWPKHGNSTKDINVLFTTESKAMVQEQKEFAASVTMQSKYPLSFNFVTNSKDVTPDTGFIKEVKSKETVDEAMVSAISSFKAQLLPRLSIGNCCSNFHTLLNDFLMDGCGVARENSFMCLQESEDPALRVCCGWHKDCKAARKKYFAELAANASSVPSR